MNIVAIDLFCGAGGLTHGMRQAGIDVRLGVDIDADAEYAYTANNESEFLLKPIEKITGSELSGYYKDSDFTVLAGCPPCQTFSTYNPKASKDDSRWSLLSEFGRLVDEVSPDFVVMENVRGLLKHSVFKEFRRGIKSRGYFVFFDVLDLSQYGVPQARKRLIFIASKLGAVCFDGIKKEKRMTVREAISGLPPLRAGGVCNKDSLHESATLSEANLKRIAASRQGGGGIMTGRKALNLIAIKRKVAKHIKAFMGAWSGISQHQRSQRSFLVLVMAGLVIPNKTGHSLCVKARSCKDSPILINLKKVIA